MSSYLQTGNTTMLLAGTTSSSTTIVNPKSPTLQLFNTGTVPVFINVGSASLPQTAPVVPSIGVTSSGYTLPPNVVVHLTTNGYRTGNITVQSIVSTGTAPVYITPVINIGDQDAVV